MNLRNLRDNKCAVFLSAIAAQKERKTINEFTLNSDSTLVSSF